MYTGDTSLAAKQVCHVATRSTVPLCHLWPVAPVSRPCVPCGPSCPLCPLWLLWTVWTLWALCSMLPLCRSFPWWPLCPLWPLWALCSLCPLWSPCLLCPLWPLWPLFLWNEGRSRSERKRDISFPNDHQTTRNQKRALRNSILTVARP